MGALMDLLDAEFPRPDIHDLGLPSRDEADDDPRALGELDTVAVAHVEGLQLVSLAVQDDRAVGQDTVHVEEEEFNVLCF